MMETEEKNIQQENQQEDSKLEQSNLIETKSESQFTGSLLTDSDIYLFKQGTHYNLYKKLGAHIAKKGNVTGTYFSVWAPNARSVSVIGEFNGWNKDSNNLNCRLDNSGIWEGFIPDVSKGALYKFHIVSNYKNYQIDKKDPFSFYNEIPPQTASIVWELDYEWNDETWMKSRSKNNSLKEPISIYEVHLGSWKRIVEENSRYFTYRELAQELVSYVKKMGFTHVEFMPIMEHPFYGSWGYQIISYFASTSRYGTPQDLMYLIDCFHQEGIGVILDWVPSHFPSDGYGLSYFDGTHLYEHSDPRKGIHPDWNCNVFNHGRNEVREFLISNALFWLDKYHVDGLRVDAVASMLYLDYSRSDGQWTPNIYGGRDNLESIAFIKELNEVVYKYYPDTQMIAEESTAWAMVSRPVSSGGLGFGMKWNMGWMHDTLEYFKKNPIYRKYHHNELTFSMLYAFTENFILSLSHDEVVHGKGSLIRKMPCDDWQKFANLRLLYGYMYAHPGKKLLFMGGEFGQFDEWYHEKSLDWHLLEHEPNKGLNDWIKDLNNIYKKEKALHKFDFESKGFEWIDANNWEQGVLCYLRRTENPSDTILGICNFTPTPYYNYSVGVPYEGYWKELLNSDAKEYWGGGIGNAGGVNSDKVPSHGREFSLNLVVPPLAIVLFKGPEVKIKKELKKEEDKEKDILNLSDQRSQGESNI